VLRVSKFASMMKNFEPGTADTVWLARAGVEGWVVLTKDSKIRYRSNETEVIFAAKVRAFVLVSSNLPGSEMATIFVEAFPSIKRLCARQIAPLIAHVHRSGHVVLKLPNRTQALPRIIQVVEYLISALPSRPRRIDSRRSIM
jgi:hypothetical protein